MQVKPPKVAAFGGFFWDFVGLLPINPLTDVVANYTCHDRNKKRSYVIQQVHLLPDGRSRLGYCIMKQNAFQKKKFCKCRKSVEAFIGRPMSAPAGTHILPYKAKCIRALFGHLMHFVYLTIFSNYGRWYTANINFPFSIFKFQFELFGFFR